MSFAEDGSSEYTVFSDTITTTSTTVTGLSAGVTYVFHVQARNQVGYSPASAEASVLAAQIPNAPLSFANEPTITTASQIGLQWVAPTFNGGSPIIDYRVWYDNALGGSFIVLAANIVDTDFLVTSVNKGQTYRFKLQARNQYGYSAFSNEIAILAAQLPATPSTPTTSFDADYVTISWDEPDNMGSPITSYEILIEKSDGNYQTNPTYCDGSQPAIIVARSCSIPASAINGSPYLKAWGSSIWAKVSATNLYGTSDHSTLGNGAVIVTVPDSPRNVANNPAVTSTNKIGIVFDAGFSDGGLPVLDYRISWDQGTGQWVVRQEGLSTLSYTAASVQMGTVYSFRVEARNAYGYSSFSSEVSILAASVPSQPSAPTTYVSGDSVVIQWSEPSTNGSPIESYTITIR